MQRTHGQSSSCWKLRQSESNGVWSGIGLLISGSEVRVLHGPPITTGTSRTAGVPVVVLVLITVLLPLRPPVQPRSPSRGSRGVQSPRGGEPGRGEHTAEPSPDSSIRRDPSSREDPQPPDRRAPRPCPCDIRCQTRTRNAAGADATVAAAAGFSRFAPMNWPVALIHSVNLTYSWKCFSAPAGGICSITFSAQIRHRNFISYPFESTGESHFAAARRCSLSRIISPKSAAGRISKGPAFTPGCFDINWMA